MYENDIGVFKDEGVKERNFMEIQKEVVEILEERNLKYGDTNLLDMGLLGLIVRLNDKLQRIKQIPLSRIKGEKEMINRIEDTEKEVLKDQLIDIQGYQINVLRLIDRLTVFGEMVK